MHAASANQMLTIKPINIILFYKDEILWFVGCTFVEVIDTAIGNIRATTISGCAGGIIIQTEYWNVNRSNLGYWHNENDVKNFSTIKDGYLTVSYYLLKK